MPHSGSKYNTKWVDLLFGESENGIPRRVEWIELKDIGRSARTMTSNLKGVGHDLAALYTLRVSETKQLWLNPPAHIVDRGRQEEWNRLAPWLDAPEHLIAQIVIIPHSFITENSDEIAKIWLQAFEARIKSVEDHGIKISSCNVPTNDLRTALSVYALVTSLPQIVN